MISKRMWTLVDIGIFFRPEENIFVGYEYPCGKSVTQSMEVFLISTIGVIYTKFENSITPYDKSEVHIAKMHGEYVLPVEIARIPFAPLLL